MFNKQTSVVKIFWDNENINKLFYGGGILYVIYSIEIYTIFLVRILMEVWLTISPIYQWENFNEIRIIKANINGEYIHSRKSISNRTYRGSFDVL